MLKLSPVTLHNQRDALLQAMVTSMFCAFVFVVTVAWSTLCGEQYKTLVPPLVPFHTYCYWSLAFITGSSLLSMYAHPRYGRLLWTELRDAEKRCAGPLLWVSDTATLAAPRSVKMAGHRRMLRDLSSQDRTAILTLVLAQSSAILSNSWESRLVMPTLFGAGVEAGSEQMDLGGGCGGARQRYEVLKQIILSNLAYNGADREELLKNAFRLVRAQDEIVHFFGAVRNPREDLPASHYYLRRILGVYSLFAFSSLGWWSLPCTAMMPFVCHSIVSFAAERAMMVTFLKKDQALNA